jgi:hypothetical protein
METSTAPATDTTRKTYLTRILVISVGLALISQASGWSRKILQNSEAPWWMRLVPVAMPWLVGMLLYLLVYRRVRRADELEALVNHRALAFAFSGMFFWITVIGQLQTARLIPVFEWTTFRLTMSMIGLLAAGILWNKRRYA